ncbi:MAG: GNAT family N-acetyltransferase, partial [Anaerolineae bacterium]|nr:GNAT family N-acetyltransferase [Anaerolineae bacterium]
MNSRWLERVKELTAVYTLRHGRSTREDAQLFTDLFNATYPRKIPADYYSWQFFGGAFPGVCLLAEVGGKLAGCVGLRVLPLEGVIKGRIGLVVDLIITPEHQRTGLLARLEMEIEALAWTMGCGCLVGLSNLAAYEPRIHSLGWTAMPRK